MINMKFKPIYLIGCFVMAVLFGVGIIVSSSVIAGDADLIPELSSGTGVLQPDIDGDFEYSLVPLDNQTHDHRFALNGSVLNDATQDAVEHNPLRVDVMLTDGGGGPGVSGTNEFENEGCGKPKLSSCLGSMDEHTNAIAARYPLALQDMSAQFVSVMMQYVFAVGQILDDGEQHIPTTRL